MRWLDKKEIAEFATAASNIKSADFFARCWEEGAETYLTRLKAISFENLGSVLDAGCGSGQWAACLAELNEKVTAIDLSEDHIATTRKITECLGIKNITVQQEDISCLSFPDNNFDAVFCYSVIYLTDYRKSLREFFRVLKEGGKLYIVTNDLGRYLYMFEKEPNKSAEYDPRAVAADTIQNSLQYFAGGKYIPGKQILMPVETIKEEIMALGFSIKNIGAEGSMGGKSFYPADYYGIAGVYEILAEK